MRERDAHIDEAGSYESKMDASVSPVIDEIDRSISQCVEQAEEVIAEYWLWIDKSNKALRQAKKQAESSGDVDGIKSKKMAYTGPRIEMIQSGSGTNKRAKPNLIWSYYPYNGIRLKAGASKKSGSIKFSQMGRRIKMTNNKEYNESTLVQHSVGWDASRMLSTELKLMPIREKLEALNKAKIEINKIDKRINRIANRYVEALNG